MVYVKIFFKKSSLVVTQIEIEKRTSFLQSLRHLTQVVVTDVEGRQLFQVKQFGRYAASFDIVVANIECSQTRQLCQFSVQTLQLISREGQVLLQIKNLISV